MIKIQESESLFTAKTVFKTLGWWVEVGGDTIYNVSDDGGPGDHMGFLWAGDNLRKMIPESENIDVMTFRLYYPTSGFYEPNELKNFFTGWADDEKEEYKELRAALIRHPPRWWQNRYEMIRKKIFMRWQRVLYHRNSKEVSVMVGDKSQENYETLMSFLMNLSEHLPVDKVFVETDREDPIWTRIPFDDVMSSKRF